MRKTLGQAGPADALAPAVSGTPARPAPRRLRAQAARRPRGLAGSGKFMTGLALLAVFVLLALIGPLLVPYDPSATSQAIAQPPSGAHLLGTTQTGQDVLSQLLVGARSTLLVAFVAGALATAVAVVVGVASGYLRGLGGELLSVLTNVFLVIPSLPLMIILAGSLGSSGWLPVAIVISVTGWAFGARLLRAQTLSIRGRDYVRAARVRGEGTWRIMLAEILPNLGAIVVTSFLFLVLFAILAAAGLDFLGLGSLSDWSWGAILYWAQNASAFTTGAWWWYVPPGLCIALLGTSLVLLNFAVDELINPRLRAAAPSRGQRRARPAPAAAPAAKGSGTGPAAAHGADVVLDIRGLTASYGTGPDSVRAVRDVSLTLHRGEVVGLVGESGSGKSTLGYAITRLLRPPGAVTGGQVEFRPQPGDGTGTAVDLLSLGPEELRKLRWDEISIVFQSAMNSLNPVTSIGHQLTDVIRAHRPQLSASEGRQRAAELLELVRISPDRLDSYQHELSGGQRQRVMLAMALALEPQVVVMDEPTTALDVVVQREVLGELLRLRAEFGFAVLFITHDLSLVLEIADTVAVMYAGRLVEIAPAAAVGKSQAHPYAEGLLKSFPSLQGPRQTLGGIPGSPPDLREMPSGCAFHPRCPAAMQVCAERVPELLPVGDPGSRVSAACWLHVPQPAAGKAQGLLSATDKELT